MKMERYLYPNICGFAGKMKIILSVLMAVCLIAGATTGCTKTESINDPEPPGNQDKQAPTVISVNPVNNSTAAPLTAKPAVTFSEPMNGETLTPATFMVKKGNEIIPGTVTYSGSTATFQPSVSLEANTVFTCTITTSVEDISGNELTVNYTWSFTTGALADVTAPSVISVTPLNNATAVELSTKPTVTFSELMKAETITSASFTVKKGNNIVPGSVTYTGVSATFTPSVSLDANANYSCTITTSVKDVAGNSLAANFNWSFTTGALADVTAPTVLSVTPANNASSVEVSVKPAVSFSEAMNPATVTSSTFILKQGTTSITGSVSYSGTSAIFTPSAALTANTVYTATVTKGVKDNAGNSLASDYTWTFTTKAIAGKSFATDVVPVLNLCNTCHTHNWTPSSTPSAFHSNLVSSGHINMTTPTSGKIYSKLNGGHPSSTVTAAQKSAVMTWILEGSKNN